MADRDRFGGSERDYLPKGKAASQVNHQGYSPPWRDTRFGGNMERANTGIPYPTGGRDVRFEGSLPHKFSYLDNGRSVTSDVEPYWTDMGRNRSVTIPQTSGRSVTIPQTSGLYGGRRTGEEAWESEKAKREKMMEFMQGPLHPNPRMRGQGEGGTGLYKGSPFYSNPYYGGMNTGIGGLQEQAAVDPSDWRTILKILQAGGDPGTETKAASLGNGIGSTNEYQTAGLWQTWKKILERTGSEDLANQWLESQQAV